MAAPLVRQTWDSAKILGLVLAADVGDTCQTGRFNKRRGAAEDPVPTAPALSVLWFPPNDFLTALFSPQKFEGVTSPV